MPRIRFDELPPAQQAPFLRWPPDVAVVRLRDAGIDPLGYPLPLVTERARIEATHGRGLAREWAAVYGDGVRLEDVAQRRIDACRTWAATTSAEDDKREAAERATAEAKARREHERAVAARAKALLAADEADRAARARRRAEQELDR